MLLFLLCGGLLQSAGIDLQRTEQRYLEGDYTGCIDDCETALAEKLRLDEWPLLLARSQMALGRFPDAKRTLTAAIERNSGSIRLRLLAREVFRANGDPEAADEQLVQINELGGSRIWNYRDSPNMVALGRAALLLGADPKLVLDRFFDAARKADPDHRDAWLAAGALALDKHDYELAARLYSDAAKNFPNDPDVHFGLARAFAPSDSTRMGAALQTALDLNRACSCLSTGPWTVRTTRRPDNSSTRSFESIRGIPKPGPITPCFTISKVMPKPSRRRAQRPSISGKATPPSIISSGASSPRTIGSAKAPPGNVRLSNSIPIICQPISNTPRTSCASVNPKKAGNWPAPSTNATPTT
jgi:hypothetical protein